jgi:DNA-binding protein HU-beta
MDPTTIEVSSGHLAMVSRPAEVVQLTETAAQAALATTAARIATAVGLAIWAKRLNSRSQPGKSRKGGIALPLTQAQLVTAVADRAQLSKADAKRALTALDEIVLQELGNAQKVRIGGLVQLTVRVKPAQKKRKGRNPATGEEIDIAAKPASVDLRARPLAKAKGALPSVQKARRRLAA